MKVVIVTGSRNWKDPNTIGRALGNISPDLIIHGDAKGADSIANEWAALHDCFCIRMPANWEKDGKAAGPIRNSGMIKLGTVLKYFGHDVKVLAFLRPESIGTRDCIKRAEHANIELEVFNE